MLGTVAALALAIGVVVQLVRRRSVPGRTIAAFGAIVFMYGLLALIRAQLFDGAAMYSRYAYVSGIFALLGLTALIGVRAMPETKSARLAVFAGFVAVATLAIVWNLWLLVAGRAIFEERAAHTRAVVTVVLGETAGRRGSGQVVLLDRTVTRLREVLAEHGSPLEDSLAGDRVPPVDQSIVEEIRQDLVTQAAELESATATVDSRGGMAARANSPTTAVWALWAQLGRGHPDLSGRCVLAFPSRRRVVPTVVDRRLTFEASSRPQRHLAFLHVVFGLATHGTGSYLPFGGPDDLPCRDGVLCIH